MKRLAIILFLSVLMIPALMAQQNNPERKNRDRVPGKQQEIAIEKLTKELSLTPEQAKQVQELMENRRLEMKTNREEQKQLRETQQKEKAERLERAKERQKEHNAKMKEILTTEQYIRYLELKNEQKEVIRDNRKMKMEQRKQKQPVS